MAGATPAGGRATSIPASKQRPDRAAVAAGVAALTAAFGNRVVTSQAVREQHGNTVTWLDNEPPDAVVFPQSTADVQAIVCICAVQACRLYPSASGLRWTAMSTRRSAACRSTSAT